VSDVLPPKWSPGPWRALPRDGEELLWVENDEQTIALVCDNPRRPGSQAANVKVIAAAPEMREALRDISVLFWLVANGADDRANLDRLASAVRRGTLLVDHCDS